MLRDRYPRMRSGFLCRNAVAWSAFQTSRIRKTPTSKDDAKATSSFLANAENEGRVFRKLETSPKASLRTYWARGRFVRQANLAAVLMFQTVGHRSCSDWLLYHTCAMTFWAGDLNVNHTVILLVHLSLLNPSSSLAIRACYHSASCPFRKSYPNVVVVQSS